MAMANTVNIVDQAASEEAPESVVVAVGAAVVAVGAAAAVVVTSTSIPVTTMLDDAIAELCFLSLSDPKIM